MHAAPFASLGSSPPPWGVGISIVNPVLLSAGERRVLVSRTGFSVVHSEVAPLSRMEP